MLSLCRLCAHSVDEIEISSQISELEPKLKLCCGWTQSEHEWRMPQRACQMCVDELQRSWSFAERIQAAEQQLNEFTSVILDVPRPTAQFEEVAMAIFREDLDVDLIGPQQFEHDFDSDVVDDTIKTSDVESSHSNERQNNKRKNPTKKTKEETKKNKLIPNSLRKSQSVENRLECEIVDANRIIECTKKPKESTKNTVHAETHAAEKPYSCNYCEYRSTTWGNVRKHSMRIHGITIYRESTRKTIERMNTNSDPFLAVVAPEDCLPDGKISPSGVAKLKQSFPDMKTMTWADCQFKCEECNQTFQNPQNFFTHNRSIHLKNIKSMDFFCFYCNAKHQLEHNLNQHIAKEHFPHLKFRCYYCTDYYWDDCELVKHRRMHTDVEYKCEQCGKITWNRDALYLHVAQSHRLLDGPEETFTCDLCNKVFKSKSHIQIHMIIHTQQFDFVCDQCGWKFKTKGNLKSHLETIHSSKQPFSCKQCDKRFKTKNLLNKHSKVHEEYKRFECTNCNKKFRHNSALAIHMRGHNKIYPYACKYCNKKFSCGSNWKSHTRTHTAEKPYTCNHCEYSTAYRQNLQKHSMRIHSIDLRIRKNS